MIINDSLLLDCKNQIRKAQFELYHKCFAILMGICLRYYKNSGDAESMLNRGFLKIVTKIDKYNTNTPFEAWIRRIMINTIIDDYRKNKKEKEVIKYIDFEQGYACKVVFRNEADLMFDAQELQEMIDRLPPVSKRIFNMHLIDGFSHKEIANDLEISVGTSKWHVSNARKILRKKIKSANILN